VRVLSRLFRRLFLDELCTPFAAGKLGFFGALAGLAEPGAFTRRLRELRRVQWVVYAKPPFGGPAQVLHLNASHRFAERPREASHQPYRTMSPICWPLLQMEMNDAIGSQLWYKS
jgi:hypothetical protein